MSYSKYYLYKKQISRDNGVSWVDVTPLETAPSGDPIATYASLAECEAHDYSLEYLTFVAEESGTFKFVKSSGNTTDIQYSLDSGSTWATLASNTNSPTVESGHTIMWKGTLNPIAWYDSDYPYGIGRFSSSGNFSIEGNAMSLLFGDNFSGQTSLSGKNYSFATLFSGCTSLTSAEKLELPATTLSEECYLGMFSNCTNLTKAPQLPATTLAQSCYSGMFNACESLTAAPILLAPTLATFCYSNMFWGCDNLKYLKCLATDITALDCTFNWLSYVGSNGTFVKDPSMTVTTSASATNAWKLGSSGVPSNWTVQDAT